MRVVIVQSGLSAGGAEKIVNLLAHHRARLGDEVHVLVFGGTRQTSYFPYAEGISISTMTESGSSEGGAFLRVGKRLAWLRKQIRTIQPELVVSFLTKTNVITLLACLGLHVPVAISERNNPYRQEGSMFWRGAIAVLQPFASLVVMQTTAAKETLSTAVQARSVVIPNPTTQFLAASGRIFSGHVVAVGRLTPQKGFDLLLQAFARVVPLVTFATLTIFGDGPERANLIALSKKLGIAERVNFPGTTREPGEWVKEADIFVLSSRYEGFPNVLVEAVSAGLPSIAFACPWGPSDILTHEKNGLLVETENVTEMARALERLLTDDDLRISFARETVKIAHRFDVAKVMAQWDEAIQLAVARPS